MQFSLNLIAAAAFLLPNLIVARAVHNDAVAKREAFASPEAEALSNLEITRRDFESSIEAAQVKRDAYAEAIEHVESVTSHQLVTRGQPEDLAKWEKIHTEYKSHQKVLDGLSKGWKKETDATKKADDLAKIIAALKEEIKGREEAQKLLPGLLGYSGWTQQKIDGHAVEISDKKKCLQKYENKEQGTGC